MTESDELSSRPRDCYSKIRLWNIPKGPGKALESVKYSWSQVPNEINGTTSLHKNPIVTMLCTSNPPSNTLIYLNLQVSLQVPNNELLVHVIFYQRISCYNKRKPLHEHRRSITRPWSVLFSFQALLLTVLNTAGATQVLSLRETIHDQADGFRKRNRCRSLDGLMVCQQAPLAPWSYFTIMPSL